MNKNLSLIAASVCLMIGLIVSAIILGNSYKSSKQYDRVVNVKGLCEMEVEADMAICPFVFKIGGNDMGELYKKIEYSNNIVVEFLKDAGISENEITIAPPKLNDRSTEWSNEYMKYEYVITSVVTVCTNKVKDIVELEKRRGELLLLGVPISETWEYTTTYSFTKLNDIKPQMIETATKNARETALKFAEDSNSKLGKIKRASQGQFSIENRDINTPYLKKVRVVSSIDYYLND